MNDNLHLSEDDKMTVLVSCEAPGVIQALEKRGVRVLTVDICEQLDVPVRSHADMQVLPLDDCVLISPYQTRLKTQLEQMNLRVIVGEELEKRLEALLGTLERMRLDEYVEHISNRKRLIWDNLLYGMVRGFGFTLGFAVLAALCAVVLKNMVVENIPVIGGFLAEVINAIEARM